MDADNTKDLYDVTLETGLRNVRAAELAEVVVSVHLLTGLDLEDSEELVLSDCDGPATIAKGVSSAEADLMVKLLSKFGAKTLATPLSADYTKDLYDVTLAADKLNVRPSVLDEVVFAVHLLTGLDLEDSEELVLSDCDGPATIAKGVSSAEADLMVKLLSKFRVKALATAHSADCSIETVKEILAKFKKLTGLDAVTAKVEELVCINELANYLEDQSLPSIPPTLNLVFTGNPGTGKTTVARLVAKLYKALGMLDKGHLVEVGRADLVGNHIGESEKKCTAVFESALDGVLFIDEAYSLSSVGHPRDYGLQVINLLVQFMENHRGRLAVVVAGYSKEMKGFIESNPGLKSRFQTFIEFEDFSAEELVEIFKSEAVHWGIAVGDEVAEALEHQFEQNLKAYEKGNGRLVRNLVSDMFAKMAVRLNQNGHLPVENANETTQETVAEGFTVEDIPTEEGWLEVIDTSIPVGFQIPKCNSQTDIQAA